MTSQCILAIRAMERCSGATLLFGNRECIVGRAANVAQSVYGSTLLAFTEFWISSPSSISNTKSRGRKRTHGNASPKPTRSVRGSSSSIPYRLDMILGKDRASSETFLRLDCGSLAALSFVAMCKDDTWRRRSSAENCSGCMAASKEVGIGSAATFRSSSEHRCNFISADTFESLCLCF